MTVSIARASSLVPFRAVVTLVAACTLVSGCVSGSDNSARPSNQATGTLVGGLMGGAVGGLAFRSVGGVVGGTLIGALAGNLVGRALDDQERRRLAEATQRAYVADTDEPVTYTVPPSAQTQTASGSPSTSGPQATVVSAKPAGPKTVKTDGGSCRPIELTATKNGQTTKETTTFCQAAGSNDLKPVSV
jgi:surface antigen